MRIRIIVTASKQAATLSRVNAVKKITMFSLTKEKYQSKKKNSPARIVAGPSLYSLFIFHPQGFYTSEGVINAEL